MKKLLWGLLGALVYDLLSFAVLAALGYLGAWYFGIDQMLAPFVVISKALQ